MIVKKTSLLAAMCFSLGFGIATHTPVRADTPWSNLLAVNRVEADENKPYVLEEKHGPWIIMACSFNGPNAEKQAHELVLELRSKYHLEAFVHHYHFKLDDPNGDVPSIAASPRRHVYEKVNENPKQYADGQIKEIAVVVGNFIAVDDPDAQRTLKKLKVATPDCLNPARDENQSRSLAWWREIQTEAEKLMPKDVEGRRLNGPLSRAFITRNPLLSEELFAPKSGLDDFVVKMNEKVPHSLLDCPGKYTVQVAHFTGEVILNQGEIRAIENGTAPGPESSKHGLAQAATKAHELTEALRIKGYEAYEFHDRTSSIVTVGSFSAVGVQQPDRQVRYTPQVQWIVDRFGLQKIEENGRPPEFRMQSCMNIYFDAQPIPIEVPRRSIGRMLGQHLDMAGQ